MRTRITVAAIALITATIAGAQESITLPPSGDNQPSSVSQNIGPVRITIDYNSPKVHNPRTGEDRRGKIWGKLVPMGFAKGLGFGTCTECPWRVGANENTTFTVTHDVKVEGQPLPAGTYGLFMAPGEDEWTIVFSKSSTSWGSYFYDPKEDALRVKVKPAKSEYHEWLTFDFIERDKDKATVAMKWEELQVPVRVSVDNINEIYLTTMREELRGSHGFNWMNLVAAAEFALEHKLAPKEALQWAQAAAASRWPGSENMNTLLVLARAQAANGMETEAKVTRQKALSHPGASPGDINQYARQLLNEGRKEEAMAIFELNAKRHGTAWPVNVGLARGNSALGRYKEAAKYAKRALAQAPDEATKKMLQSSIEKLEQGKDMN